MTMDLVRDILEAEQPPLIHIGYPKALSSWLQGRLFSPQNGFKKVMGPLPIKQTLINPPPLEFNADDLREHFTSTRQSIAPLHQNVPVITSEGLVGNRSTGGHDAKLLADRLAAYFGTARILIIVREQQSMLRALYKNLVRGLGYTRSIAWLLDPVHPDLVPQITPAFLRYDALVAYYRQRFGPERVLVLPYELFIEDPATFAGRIASFAGGAAEQMGVDQLPTNQVVNPASGLTAVTAMRLIHKALIKSPFDPWGIIRSDKGGIRKWRMRMMDRIDRLVPDSLDRRLERRLARYIAEHTAGAFHDSNRRLSEMMDLDLSRYGYELPVFRPQASARDEPGRPTPIRY